MRWLLGLAASAAWAAAPVISNVTDNAGGGVNRYQKLEVSFSITTVATNPMLPYVASPPTGVDPTNYPDYKGVSVDLLTTPDNWTTTYESPCFYYQAFDDQQKVSWQGGTHEWMLPLDSYFWKCRFAPNATGSWKYRIRAQDSEGTTTTGDSSAITVSAGTSKGFVKVSSTDNRYFEYSDGTPFWTPGIELVAGLDNPSLNNQPLFGTMDDYNIRLVRMWLSDIWGSAWIEWHQGNGAYDGYLPRASLEPVQSGDGKQYLAAVLMEADGWYHPCRYQGWTDPEAVEQSTNYRFQITYRATNITGPRTTGSYGVVGKVSNSAESYCQDAGVGTVVTSYGGNSDNWTTISGTWASGTNNFVRKLHVALENASTGKVWVKDISLRKDLGGGNYGPELIRESSMQYETYAPQQDLFALDKVVALAEQYGIYLKLVLGDKSDIAWWKLDDDGTWVIGGESDNEDGYYAGARALNKTHWLHQAWWRYAQARWGYSTAIHTWELTNEGDPNDTNHWRHTDELAKFMRCRVFGQSVAYTDSQTCTYEHPNRHLVTTSFWTGWPTSFWGSSVYPNPDYSDLHAYINTSVASSGEKAVMEDDSAYYHLWHADYYNALRGSKPFLRGESGMDTIGANEPQADIQLDTGGVWYRNFLWSQIGPDHMPDIYWWTTDIYGGSFDHRPLALGPTAFMSGIPVNNGNYVDVAASATSGLRVVGQKDLTAKRAHLWVQNDDWTWRNVVDSVSITPITGTVQVSGLSNSTSYLVATYNTVTGAVSGTAQIATNGSGVLTIPVTSLSADTAFQLSEATVPSVNRTGTVTQSGGVR